MEAVNREPIGKCSEYPPDFCSVRGAVDNGTDFKSKGFSDGSRV